MRIYDRRTVWRVPSSTFNEGFLMDTKTKLHPRNQHKECYDFDRLVDMDKQRPKDQWWLDLQPIARVLARPNPDTLSK